MTCDFCHSSYSISIESLKPRIQRCGHTYCTECCTKLIKNGKLTCNLCGTLTHCNDVSVLPQNWALNQFLIAKTTIENDIGIELDDTCNICQEEFLVSNEYSRPRIHKCGHSNCSHCCSLLIKNGTVKCPLCYTLTECKNVLDLPHNWGLMQTLMEIEKISMSEMVIPDNTSYMPIAPNIILDKMLFLKIYCIYLSILE